MLYPNPVAQEVICFLGFKSTVEAAVFSAFYKKIEQEYPLFTPVAQQTLDLEIGPSGPHQTQHTVQQLMRYSQTEGKAILTLAPDGLALHLLKPYPGWEQMLQSTLSAWSHLVEVVHPSAIHRVMLRYVNIIPCDAETDTLGRWLKPNAFLPEAVVDSYPFVPYQVIVNKEGGKQALRLLIARVNSTSGLSNAFLWEIEKVQSGEFATDAHTVSTILEQLHKDVRSVFDTAVGAELQAAMQRKDS
jgi:uncharacterized protein (TIGR04255 family)